MTKRQKAERRNAIATLIATGAAFVAILFTCYSIDAARGISVSQSLESVGL